MSTIKVIHGSSHKYAVQGKRAKDALSRDEQDLYELCSLSGVDMSPAVYRIVLDLLRLNVSPVAIVQMLKSMVHRSAKSPITSASEAFSTLQTPSSYTAEVAKSSGSSGISTGSSRTNHGSQHSSRTGVKTSRSRPAGKTSQKTSQKT